MRILHTADWHLGKTLEGRSRLSEQAEVLEELNTIVKEENIDAVIMAGMYLIRSTRLRSLNNCITKVFPRFLTAESARSSSLPETMTIPTGWRRLLR